MAEASMYEQKKYDKRLIERHLTTGLASAKITAQDLQKHLDDLPDLSANCELSEIPQPITGLTELPSEETED
jgi:hypothetical protein